MGAWQWAKKLPFYVLFHVSPHKNATKPLIGHGIRRGVTGNNEERARLRYEQRP